MNIIRFTQPNPEFILKAILTWFIEENNSEPIVASKFSKIYSNENYGYLQKYVKSFKGPKKLITENKSSIDYQGNKYKIIWEDNSQSHGKGQISIRNIDTTCKEVLEKETINLKSLPKECPYCNKKFKTTNALNGHLKVHKEEKKEFEEFKRWNNRKKSSGLVDSITEEMFKINLTDIDLNSKNTYKYWNDLHNKLAKQVVIEDNDFSRQYTEFYKKKFTKDTQMSYEDYLKIAVRCSGRAYPSDHKDKHKVEAYGKLISGLKSIYTNYQLSKIDWDKNTYNEWEELLSKEKTEISLTKQDSTDVMKQITIVEFYRNYFLNN